MYHACMLATMSVVERYRPIPVYLTRGHIKRPLKDTAKYRTINRIRSGLRNQTVNMVNNPKLINLVEKTHEGERELQSYESYDQKLQVVYNGLPTDIIYFAKFVTH